MESKLALMLRNKRNKSSIVRTRTHLRKPDGVASDKKFDAEDPLPAERFRHFLRDPPGALERSVAHGLGLPGLDIIAVHLNVADGIAKMRSVPSPDGEQRDLEIKRDLSFNDNARLPDPGGVQRLQPGRFDIGSRPQQ